MNLGPHASRYPERVVYAIDGLGNASFSLLECLTAASDANRVVECVDHIRGACDGPRRCDGDRVIDCAEGERVEIDCRIRNCEDDRACDEQPLGGTCVAAASPTCGFGRCDDTFAPHCEGEMAVFCTNGAIQHRDCRTALGRPATVCRAGACAAMPASCARDQSRHCEGDDIVSCFGGEESRTRCAQFPLPMTCTGAECVASPRLRCNPSAHYDACDGQSLRYCDGQERTLDCRALGFAGCRDGTCVW